MNAGGIQTVVTQLADDYQPGGQAWNPDREDIVRLLESGRYESIEPIYYGSNHTFLVTISADGAGQSLAVYKPARGEYPLYDFPHGTLYKREVGAWLLDNILGWGLVPPTVSSRGKYGLGSLQLFIDALPSAEVRIESLQPIALLDVLLNNADRKIEHCLPVAGGRLWAIDHGLTFHIQPKLRTILWHFASTPIPARQLEDIERLRRIMERRRDARVVLLGELLSGPEWRALEQRVRRVLDLGAFPDPRQKPVPYRW